MALRLLDGDYIPDEVGGFVDAKGVDAILERVIFRLKAKRGKFPLMPELGSRLYLLYREKPECRQGAAEQYVREALLDEPDIQVSSVELTQKGEELFVNVTVFYGDQQISFGVTV